MNYKGSIPDVKAMQVGKKNYIGKDANNRRRSCACIMQLMIFAKYVTKWYTIENKDNTIADREAARLSRTKTAAQIKCQHISRKG